METSKSKRKAGSGSGCLFILVGVIVIGAVSYEAAQIVYHSDIKQNQIITGGTMNNGIFILLNFLNSKTYMYSSNQFALHSWS